MTDDCPRCELLRAQIRRMLESSDEMWRRLRKAHEMINRLEAEKGKATREDDTRE